MNTIICWNFMYNKHTHIYWNDQKCIMYGWNCMCVSERPVIRLVWDEERNESLRNTQNPTTHTTILICPGFLESVTFQILWNSVTFTTQFVLFHFYSYVRKLWFSFKQIGQLQYKSQIIIQPMHNNNKSNDFNNLKFAQPMRNYK